MPDTRIYVVNSAALITAVQRQFMTLAFPPIEVRAAINVMGGSDAAKTILTKNMDPKEGDWDSAYAVSYSKAIHPAMSPGAGLDAMNRVVIQKLAESLETLKTETPKVVELFDWVRQRGFTCHYGICLRSNEPIQGLSHRGGFLVRSFAR